MTFGLRNKIVLFASGLVIVIGISLFSVTYYHNRVSIRALRVEQMSNVLYGTVSLVKTPMYLLDVRQLRDIISTVLQRGDLAIVWILDKEGRVLTDGSKKNPMRNKKPDLAVVNNLLSADGGAEAEDDAYFWFGHPVLLANGQNLGFVVLGMDAGAFSDQLTAAIHNQLYVLIPALFLSILIAIGFARRIIQPLNDVTKVAQQIGSGDWHQRVSFVNKDEIGDLSKSINIMAEKLFTARDELENRMRLALNAGHIATWDWQPDDDLLVFDDHLPKILGQKLEGFGNSLSGLTQFIHDDDRDSVTKIFKRSVTSREPIDIEFRVVASNGSIITIAEKAIVRDGGDEGSPLRLVGTVRDITDSKKAETNLIAAKELSEQARKDADAANKARGDFLANMSHEIRTPMNAVIGLSYLAMKTKLSNKQLDYLKKINSSSNTLLGIINDILDFSKIEAGKLEVEHIQFNIDEMLNGLLTMMVSKAQDKGLEVIIVCPKEVPRNLIGDPLRLGQILINLTNNAIKFTEEGEIIISIKLLEKKKNKITLEFEISDSGMGMNEKQMDELFKPFFQADTSTTRKYGGTGLGLTISKQLVEMMGGKIRVKSATGKGSSFFFSSEFDLSTKDLIPQDFLETDLHGKWVLVVDDNQVSQEFLYDQLTTMSFNVHTVNSGKDALSELHRVELELDSQSYDLILVDWKMPGMNGIETAKWIKVNKAFTKAPIIIMISAYGHEDLKQQVEDAGLDGFILKPFDESVLLNTIVNAFGRRQMGSVEKIRDQAKKNESLKIIQGAHILVVEDNEINQQVVREMLEDKEFIVTIAKDGRESVDILKGNPNGFDLVLMDIQMPVMDGYQATLELRKDPRFKNLPILAMTAHAMLGEKEKSIANGMNDHITKPLYPTVLFDALVKWIKPDVNSGEKTKDSTPVKAKPQAKGSKDNLPDDLPGIDMNIGLMMVAGNRKLYLKLLEKFYHLKANSAVEIKDALNNNDMNTVMNVVHSIKGVSGNIGAMDLFSAATVFDEAVSKEETHKFDELYANYQRALNVVINSLGFIDQQKPSSPPAD